MNKYNKIEIFGFILLLIGAISWMADSYLEIIALKDYYFLGQFLLWTGLLIWALGYMKREKEKGKDKPNSP